MEEITLLDALQRLWHFKAKRKTLVFEVTFDDGITRKAYFGKSWSRVMGNWQYIVQDGEHAPGFCYDEKAAGTEKYTGNRRDDSGAGRKECGKYPAGNQNEP